jgi:thiamine biosynthesis lipoprotein
MSDAGTRLHHSFQREVDVMGTVITIDLYGGDVRDEVMTARRVDAAELRLHEADEIFSTWKTQSPLSRLRRGELSLVDFPDEILEVLDACRSARDATEGWFDPWSMPGGVDPTGLVKGWAAQRALNELKGLDLAGAVVNAAGDIASFGGPNIGEAFRFGIVRPDNPMTLAFVVESPGAVATSGTYQRGNHLVNPFTREARSTVSATVTGPELGPADALATALAVAGRDGMGFIDKLEHYEGLVIESAGTYVKSQGFRIAENLLD